MLNGICISFLFASLVAAAVPGMDLLSSPTIATQPPQLPPGPKTCNAQNVLDNCLAVEGQALAMCSYSDWACKCQAQKSIAGCFSNCPSDEARSAHEGQVTVFCNAAKRAQEEEEKSKSSSKSHPTSKDSANEEDIEQTQSAQQQDNSDDEHRRHRQQSQQRKKNNNAENTLASFSAESGSVSSQFKLLGQMEIIALLAILLVS
ncbi:hypothetical protein IWW36_002037 [Coemansia brasiliensis]|uniref:Uncharacterized protein n=1 Tax=Coemansia brasiliensis TaxID=2650707 RepID=A0A9W8LZU1_9FUNG|nr:hypothetical protein IWW36_002037 [Coemansia brasiliensis]